MMVSDSNPRYLIDSLYARIAEATDREIIYLSTQAMIEGYDNTKIIVKEEHTSYGTCKMIVSPRPRQQFMEYIDRHLYVIHKTIDTCQLIGVEP